MVYKVSTAKETYDQILSTLTAALNVTVPKSPKSFTKIWSAISSTIITSLYKYANDQLKNLLISTATRTGLIAIGNDYNIPIKAATHTTLEIEISAYDGAVIDIDKEFIGDFNGLSYFPEITVTATGATVTLNIISQTTGTDNNMEVGDTLTLASPIAGVGQTATVTDVIEDAIDEEDIEVYRSRLFYAKRNRGGGGNAYDYKRWAEEVDGVRRAYPITGLPYADEDVDDFLDGDMEAVGTADWTGYGPGPPVLSKVGGAYEGAQCLKIDPNGGGFAGVQQDCLTVGQGYTIKGWVQFTTLPGGVEDILYLYTHPYLVDSITITTTGWVYFESTFIAQGTIFRFLRQSTDIFYLDYLILEVSLPLQRTVFIEAEESIDADGEAPQYLLDNARESINFDPVTGYSRPPMGHIDSLLYVWSILRYSAYVTITDFQCDSSVETICKNQIEEDLDDYFKSVKFYNASLDSEFDRNDIISEATISRVIDLVMLNHGASCSSVSFYIESGSPVTRYIAPAGFLFKLGSVTYA